LTGSKMNPLRSRLDALGAFPRLRLLHRTDVLEMGAWALVSRHHRFLVGGNGERA
jgi:hypothetical protein